MYVTLLILCASVACYRANLYLPLPYFRRAAKFYTHTNLCLEYVFKLKVFPLQ